jgi:hypothetical protein
MPAISSIDKRAPAHSWNLEFKIETIANGYVITARANPSPNDPFGERVTDRKRADPWYIRELNQAPEMVQYMIDLIQLDGATEKALTNV